MSAGMMAANEAFRQQKKAFDRQLALRAKRREARLARREDLVSEPACEEMACPSCEERYLFGNECPDCSVDLVSESLLRAEQQVTVQPPALGRAVAAVVLVQMVVGVAAAAFWAWPG